jgi:hypothetical protein
MGDDHESAIAVLVLHPALGDLLAADMRIRDVMRSLWERIADRVRPRAMIHGFDGKPRFSPSVNRDLRNAMKPYTGTRQLIPCPPEIAARHPADYGRPPASREHLL